jgi:hypothetical protein
MNAGDREKLTEALGELTKMEVNLNNFAKRGPNIDSSIAEYGGTAKQYRDQVMAKRLASSKSFDLNGQRLITNVLALRDSKKKYPAQGDADVTVTMNSLKAFSDHYHEMRILFAKL